MNRNIQSGSNLNSAMNRAKLSIPHNTRTNLNSSQDNSGAKLRASISERPIRERLIHYLALKAFNKADILVKLNKDNPLNEKEKDQLESLLGQVANLNPKTSNYELLSDIMLNEIKEDWQFYNHNERQYVRKNILKAKEKSSTSSSLNQNQPKHQLSNSISASSLPHKPSAFVSIPQNSAFNKSLNLNNSFEASFNELNVTHPTSQTNNHTNNINKKVSPPKSEFKPITSNKISPPAANAKRPSSQQSAAYQQLKKEASDMFSDDDDDMSVDTNSNPLPFNPTSTINKKQNEKENEQLNSVNGNGKKNNKIDFEFRERASEIETNELNDCNKKYKKTTDQSQKQQYYQEYTKTHDEYLELHAYIEQLSKKFEKYRNEIQLLNEGSKDYTEKKHKIVAEYLELKSDAEYMRKRDRYTQIYTRLHHLTGVLNSDN